MRIESDMNAESEKAGIEAEPLVVRSFGKNESK
jgi:hypothetical protein